MISVINDIMNTSETIEAEEAYSPEAEVVQATPFQGVISEFKSHQGYHCDMNINFNDINWKTTVIAGRGYTRLSLN
jgi:hypothetical protein